MLGVVFRSCDWHRLVSQDEPAGDVQRGQERLRVGLPGRGVATHAGAAQGAPCLHLHPLVPGLDCHTTPSHPSVNCRNFTELHLRKILAVLSVEIQSTPDSINRIRIIRNIV